MILSFLVIEIKGYFFGTLFSCTLKHKHCVVYFEHSFLLVFAT